MVIAQCLCSILLELLSHKEQTAISASVMNVSHTTAIFNACITLGK